MREINWNEDAWFSRCVASFVTDEFKEWWIEFYGYPEDHSDDRHDYWIRCAFAWHGWNKSKPGS